ncbi:MAG: hypothetical protein ACREON_18615, partial [Gemmatimonadaceae bacterium]
MSTHSHSPIPSRVELARAMDRPNARALGVLCAVLAAIGAIVFIVGAITGQSRAWQALLVSWLFFTTVSQAGVVVVAVQR